MCEYVLNGAVMALFILVNIQNGILVELSQLNSAVNSTLLFLDIKSIKRTNAHIHTHPWKMRTWRRIFKRKICTMLRLQAVALPFYFFFLFIWFLFFAHCAWVSLEFITFDRKARINLFGLWAVLSGSSA